LLSLGRPIGQTLADTLGTPVYLLSGYCEPEASQLARLGRQLLFWIGALVIGAGFFWIQVNVQRLTQDWMQTVVLVLTVLIEFGLLAAWSHRLQ
jgi:apolipoprotein N-acyltransferase